MGFVGIDWSKVTAPQFEDLVQALLVETHPGAVAIDGRGGDGGRDAELSADGGRIFYEAKFFPDGLKRTQRRQVVRSLEAVAKHSAISRWVLVVPRNHNPSEKQWFEDLDLPPGCAREWLGETWLGIEIAKRPYLVRAYLRTQTEETLRLLSEYHAEGAALAGGVPELLDRFSRLTDIGDTLDPDYRFLLAERSDGAQEVTVIPRHDSAKPVRMTMSLTTESEELSDELHEQLQALYEYGDPVSLSGSDVRVSLEFPAGSELAFGGPGGESHQIELGGEEEIADEGLMEVLTARRRLLHTLPIVYRRRRRGATGGRFRGNDSSGVLSFDLSAQLIESATPPHLELKFSPGVGQRPRSVLPTLEFLTALRPPHVLAVYWKDLHLASTPMLAEITGNLPTEGDLILMRALDSLDRFVERASQGRTISQSAGSGSHLAATEDAIGTQADDKESAPADRILIPEDVPENQIPLIVAAARLIDDGAATMPFRLTSFGIDVSNDAAAERLRTNLSADTLVLLQGRAVLQVPVGEQIVRIPDVEYTHRVAVIGVEDTDGATNTSSTDSIGGSRDRLVVRVKAGSGTTARLAGDPSDTDIPR